MKTRTFRYNSELLDEYDESAADFIVDNGDHNVDIGDYTVVSVVNEFCCDRSRVFQSLMSDL